MTVKQPKRLPNRIRELRERAGLSQWKLGEIVGTSAPQIGRLEIGSRQLTVDWMRKIARALGVQPADLLPESEALPLEENEAFFGEVFEAHWSLYRELRLAVSPGEVAREAFAAFADLAKEATTREARAEALAEHIKHSRRFLQRYGKVVAPAADTTPPTRQ